MKQGWNESGNSTLWEVVVNLSLRQCNVGKVGNKVSGYWQEKKKKKSIVNARHISGNYWVTRP